MSGPEAALSLTPERLVYEFEELDLSPYQARILLALLRLGPANTAQLARVSEVPRTSTYQILEELNNAGLAQRLSVQGPAVWASPGREEVFARLDAAQEEKLKAHRARTARLRELVDQAFPEEPETAGPYVHVLQSANQISHIYDGLLARAGAELLVFSRPPYSYEQDWVNPAVLDAVARGVKARALYEREQWHDASSAGFREAMAEYHRAGVLGGLTDELPLKLAIVDRQVALLAMADPVQPDIGFPTTLLVEHPGYAALQADAFESRWAQADPVTDGPSTDTPITPAKSRRTHARSHPES